MLLKTNKQFWGRDKKGTSPFVTSPFVTEKGQKQPFFKEINYSTKNTENATKIKKDADASFFCFRIKTIYFLHKFFQMHQL